jgi:cardiolipin synthase
MRSITYTANNELNLLHCGAEFFPRLIEACEAAVREIYLETYIFSDDETGRNVGDALIRAAARGVTVKVVTDWTGTGHRTSQKLHQQFHEAGVQHRSFNPWFRRGLARTHRKICVVDCEMAFLGGLNINDDLISDDGSGTVLPAPRWDFAVRAVGDLVEAVHLETEAQWQRLGPASLHTRWQAFKKSRGLRTASSEAPAKAALVVRDTLRNRRTIQRAYLNALGQARESAMLANPYFAPGRRMRDALSNAAARGVKVTLLLGVGQFALQDAVARAYYPKLLKNGVKIVEYRRTQLHGKVAVVDRDWATVGSSNYDGLSLFVNHEANVVIRDEAFANELRRHIERGVEQGVAIRSEDFAHIKWYRRAWYGFAFFIYRSAMRLVTGGKFV